MSNSKQDFNHPDDAEYCPSCGEQLPSDSVDMFPDELLDRYRVMFECPECRYRGEVVRHESVRNGGRSE